MKNSAGIITDAHLSKCQQKRHFAYTPILSKRARIASNGLAYGFGHFSDEMRLNQVGAENQYVTSRIFYPKVSNGKW